MISKFGIFIREVREKENDSLRQMAIKLGVSAAFLSAMEVGRKQIPLEYVETYNILELSNMFKVSETCAATRKVKWLNRKIKKWK